VKMEFFQTHIAIELGNGFQISWWLMNDGQMHKWVLQLENSYSMRRCDESPFRLQHSRHSRTQDENKGITQKAHSVC
jgi:hypothetical protein